MNIRDLNEPFRRALTEVIPCAVFAVDENERIIWWNAAAEELTGYSADDTAGITCDRLRVKLALRQDSAVPRASCPFRSSDTSWQECEIRRKDGSTVPVVRKDGAVHDEAGKVIGAIHALVDVSAFKVAQSEIRTLRHEIARSGRFDKLVGRSDEMLRLYGAIDTVAATDATVVIEGETGTGKELVARTIHARSRRADKIFLPVNCAALPETLLEAELFGHVRGAFTGAVSDRAGRFEEATGGSLFLDEIGELTPLSQVKLLRALQEGEITRVGESRPRKVDARIIAATNEDLAELVKAGRFREDLYYRLRVVGLYVPPLRSRKGDIPDLVAHFIGRFNKKYNRQIDGVTPEAMQKLLACDWPGNVRQLEHALEHAFVVTPRKARALAAPALPPELVKPGPQRASAAEPAVTGQVSKPGADEKTQVLEALAAAGGNKAQAARTLHLTRAGLYKRMRRLGIS